LGTKQGCPESTTDFNIIINDILDCLDGIGVKVSGLRYKICGLLFADDLVIISPTRAKLRRGLAALDRWANLHEMEFGISKCAIMGIGQEAMDKVTSTNDSFTLGGRMIPVVTEYIYLGTLFTYDLDLDKMAGVRADKGRKALHSIRPLLATKDIPLRLRVNIFKATVIPVLSYGGELWGMNTCRCIKTQNILNEGLRVLLGVKRCSAIVSKDVLLEEFGIFSIHTITSAAKTRALCKYSTVQTVIADLVNNPPVRTGKKRTWLTGGKCWLATNYRGLHIEVTEPAEGHLQVRTELNLRQQTRSKSRKFRYYMDTFKSLTRGYLTTAIKYPLLSNAVTWVTKFRVGAVWTSRLLAKASLIPMEWSDRCPCCQTDIEGGERLHHILIQCERWADARQEFLHPLFETIHELTGIALETDPKLYCSLCLGGGIKLNDNDNVVAIPNWDAESRGENDAIIEPPFIKVAKFLKTVMPSRYGILKALFEDPAPRADAAENGMAAFGDRNDHDNDHDDLQARDRTHGIG